MRCISMNPIGELRKEHIAIERELFELESIMEDEVINYSNLVHTFRKLCELWDPHEIREEKVFAVMEKEQVKIPVYIMTSGHRDISGHVKALKDAINSGSDDEVRKSLVRDLRVIVDKIREHMLQEDEILYTIALNLFTDEELDEMSRAFEKK